MCFLGYIESRKAFFVLDKVKIGGVYFTGRDGAGSLLMQGLGGGTQFQRQQTGKPGLRVDVFFRIFSSILRA